MSTSYLHLLLADTPATDKAGFLSGMTSLEQLLAALCCVVFLAGVWAIFDLNFQLLALQKARLLAEFSPEELTAIDPEITTALDPWWKRLYERLTDQVPVSAEGDILLAHDYDGVQELDNNLPPWWKGVFYLSIIFAPIYLWYNHFSDYALSSREAYVVEMENSAAQIKAYLATQQNAIDETNVVLLTEAEALGKGKMIYSTRCSVCHGNAGEGGIGPNLTDDYWLHGGSVTDVFHTIKEGVPAKGMIAWKSELRPRDMQEVASYIKSLRGTEPEGAKEPQGELYIVEDEPTGTDGEADAPVENESSKK